jgi:putative nucleotidyltransferase with HDIG domain
MNFANQQVDPGFEFVTHLGQELSAGKLDLPAFPDVALRIKSALEDPEVTAEKVSRLISSDPIFSARILKLANSVTVNGAGSQINDIRTAITRMGFKLAYNTAVSIAVEQLKSSSPSALIHPHLECCWQHSVHVAAYSYVIAKKQTGINPDTAMMAGLLHDIGKFYILSRSEKYPELFDNPLTIETIVDDWHTGVGRVILEAWHFGDEICIVADEHEELGRDNIEHADLTDIVMVANLFSHREEKDALPELEWDAIPATRRLHLSEENADEVMHESEQEIQSIISALAG